MCVFWMMYEFIYVLCEVVIVSQLSLSLLVHYMGLCEDDPSCDKTYNAVMPLSRALTRGRYSRIVGVTSW